VAKKPVAVVEEPKVEEPVVEAAVVEEPVVEAVVEAPAVEEPKVEAPAIPSVPLAVPRPIFTTTVEEAAPAEAKVVLSAKTLAEQEAGRAKLALHSAPKG
jgi:fused signal recognition particle receptor